MKYQGSCHCGRVKFEVEGELKQFRLLTPAKDTKVYTFNKHFIKHHFCPSCGIHPYAEAADRSGKPMAAINTRCLEGVDFEKLPVKHFDGRSL